MAARLQTVSGARLRSGATGRATRPGSDGLDSAKGVVEGADTRSTSHFAAHGAAKTAASYEVLLALQERGWVFV